MTKVKKHQQGFKVPEWLRFTLKNLESVAPYRAMRVAAYIFSRPLKFKIPDKEQKAMQYCVQKKVHIAEIDRTVLTYTWENSGEKVLLAHGWSGRGTQLYRIAETLHNEGYHIVAFDAPAHGKSSGKLTNMLEMVATISNLDKKANGFDYFVGHSLGGMAILNYSKTPNKAKKIVTLGAGDNMRTIFDNFIQSVGLNQKTSQRMTTYFEEKFNVKIDSFSSSVVVQHLKTPTLIIHDEDDFDINVDCAERIEKHHPKATLIKTKGLGHRKILRDDVVLNHIKSFIQKS